MTDWVMPRESRELVGPITITVDDVEIAVTAFELALVPNRDRPVEADWTEPAVVDGEAYLLVGPDSPYVLTPGLWTLWARYIDDPEKPVAAEFANILVS